MKDKKSPRTFTEIDLINAYLHGYEQGITQKKIGINAYLIKHHGIDHLKGIRDKIKKTKERL